MTNNNMYTSYFNAYNLRVSAKANATMSPIALRAAAAVLEEKAKELEKPTLTAKQLAIIALGIKQEVQICSIDGEDRYTLVHRYDSSWSEQKAGDLRDVSNSISTLLFKNSYYIKDVGWVYYQTLLDEDGELRTFLLWN
jgi:hypothetical protein